MFAASTVLFLSFLSLASDVVAKPLSYRREDALSVRNAPPLGLQARDNGNVSFSNYNSIPDLQGFDNFYGSGNFNGGQNGQTIVIQETETKCEVVKIEIIQQKLVILQELAKRIITEQICNVETQTIVLAQHNGALQVFRDDIQRKTVNKQVGYDQQIASKFNSILNPDGTLSSADGNFTGADVGRNVVVPGGNDWNSTTSPERQPSIDAAIQAALNSTS